MKYTCQMGIIVAGRENKCLCYLYMRVFVSARLRECECSCVRACVLGDTVSSDSYFTLQLETDSEGGLERNLRQKS
jgi:hypothetical protein